MALEWINSKKPLCAVAGWSTLASIVGIAEDSKLDLIELKRLLQRVLKSIHKEPDEVRYQMNSFVIAVGSSVASLTDTAIQIGEKIGPVTADRGDNDCQVPYGPDYIEKVRQRGSIGKKWKSAKC